MLVMALTSALAVALLSVMPQDARAAEVRGPCLGCGDDTPPPSSDAGLDEDALWAEIDAIGLDTSGGQFRRPGRVKVVPRCWYRWWFTGMEYAAFWEGEPNQRALAQMPYQYRTQPLPGYQAHALKGAEEGGWYGPWRRDGVDGAFVLAYLQSHPPRFFERGEDRPDAAAEVEPQVLAEAVYRAMDLPRGTVRWNPSLQGSGATVVNIDTWVWVEGAARTATVRATLPSGPWVQVEAVIERVEVSADGAETVECGTDLGVPWSREQDAAGTSCSIEFHRSSANQPLKAEQQYPTATMQVTTVWSASWTSWLDEEPVQLGEQATTVTAEVPVAEIQSVVTGPGRSAADGQGVPAGTGP